MPGPFENQERESLWRALTAPFEGNEVGTRNQGGRTLSYITARTAMNRLDSVLGPENWWDRYTPNDKSVVCELTIRMPDGSTITKADAGGFAGMADSGDDEKSGYSDAFKRAAVKFGIGRHLYGNGVPAWADAPANGQQRQAPARQTAPQSQPARQQAPPQQQRQAPPPQQRPAPTNGNGEPQYDLFKLPRPIEGKAVAFAWAKKLEEYFRTVLISRMKESAQRRGWTTTFKDWTKDEMDTVCLETVAFIKTLQNYQGEFDELAEPQRDEQEEEDDGIPF